jgi:hypothetical protein
MPAARPQSSSLSRRGLFTNKIGLTRHRSKTPSAGWIGGDGQVAEGWEPPPGDFQGLWKTRVNYKDQAGFGKVVVILGGRYRISFFDGHSLSGRVIGGTVEWPADEITDIGCGAGVAVVNASLSSRRQSARFAGCLHDLPIGSTIPMVWGVFF